MESVEDYWNSSQNKSFSFDDHDETDEKSILEDDNVSEVSSAPVAASLNLIIGESDLLMILEESQLTELVPQKLSLEEEVKFLRRKLKDFHYCPINTTINKILMRKPYSLEMYKSLAEKEELLDRIIQEGDGEGILEVALFLKSTLKPALFLQILKSRPAAVDQLDIFYNTTMKIGEASELLSLVEREVAVFRQSMQSKNIIQKLEKLKQLVRQFKSPFVLQHVSNYCKLLELQINERLYFQPHDILDTSVLETLHYCCEKYQKWSDPSFVSPTNPFKFVESFAILQSQFEWVALNSRGKLQAWRDIELLFEKKSMLRKNHFSIALPLELTILRLYHLKAPQPTLNFFLKQVDDPVRRLILSKKVGAIHSIVESLVLVKDKQALEEFKDTLANGTAEYFNAEKAIKSLDATKSILGLRKSSSTS